MLLNKITIGYVVQTFDTELGKFVSQEFVASQKAEWEDQNGVCADAPTNAGMLPFVLVSPKDIENERIVEIDYIHSTNRQHTLANGNRDKIAECRAALSVFRDYGYGLFEAKSFIEGHFMVKIKYSSVKKLTDLGLQMRVVE